MDHGLEADLEKVLATICRYFADAGQAREVAVLAHAKASIVQSNYDSWNGGVWGYTVSLTLPEHLFLQIGGGKHVEKIERLLLDRTADINRIYENEYIEAFKIVTELTDDPSWREKAKTFVTGQGLTNQGRARSDNLAPKVADGLLFRSNPEIWLYRAFKSLGVTFAPLPVFIRGGETYRRIEPDFIVIKDGIVLQVEVDGDTVHRETPLDAHNRTTMMAHEGVHVERVNASDCDSEDRAKACAKRLLGILEKLKTNR